MLGVANGDPGLADDVNVTRKFVDIARFEVQRIVCQEDKRIRPTRDFDVAANLVEFAGRCAQVVLSLRRFNVLIVVVERDMAGGGGFVGAVVVFDVVRAERDFAILDEDVLIGDKEVALLFLRTVGGDFHDFALAGGQPDELAVSRSGRCEAAEEAKCKQKGRRDAVPAAECGDYTKHSVDEVVG